MSGSTHATSPLLHHKLFYASPYYAYFTTDVEKGKGGHWWKRMDNSDPPLNKWETAHKAYFPDDPEDMSLKDELVIMVYLDNYMYSAGSTPQTERYSPDDVNDPDNGIPWLFSDSDDWPTSKTKIFAGINMYDFVNKVEVYRTAAQREQELKESRERRDEAEEEREAEEKERERLEKETQNMRARKRRNGVIACLVLILSILWYYWRTDETNRRPGWTSNRHGV